MAATQAARNWAALRQQFGKHLNPGIVRLSDHILVDGKGSYVTTDDGTRLLDFSTGIGVANLGHCHPKVVRAVQEQAGRIMHAQINMGYHEKVLELNRELLKIMPTGGQPGPSPLDSFFYWNSGSEAVEAAIKIARHATGKQNVIVFRGAHHGRTMGTMGLTTSKISYRAGFGPFPPGGVITSYPYCARCLARPAAALSGSAESAGGQGCCGGPLADLEQLLHQETSADETAAVLIEPVQGEGGYVVPPQGFMKGVRDFCDRHGILMIADEIQSGAGRTGEWWAVNHSDVVPDILVFAKGIGSGMPISGVASRSELTATQPSGSMGGTYVANAVSCASAVATIQAMRDEDVLSNATLRGRQLTDGLVRISGGAVGGGTAALGSRFPFKDLRGLGLMVGLEFDAPQGSGVAGAVTQACLRRGMILLVCSSYETVRFIPPLNVSEAEMDEGLGIFEDAVKDVLL